MELAILGLLLIVGIACFVGAFKGSESEPENGPFLDAVSYAIVGEGYHRAFESESEALTALHYMRQRYQGREFQAVAIESYSRAVALNW